MPAEFQCNTQDFQVARIDCKMLGDYLEADAAKAIRGYDSDAIMTTLQSYGTRSWIRVWKVGVQYQV